MLNDIIKAIIVITAQFISGSVMYSYYLRKFAKVSANNNGDGNPGVLNLWKAAGWKYGVAGMILDYMKGIFPLLIFILTGFAENHYIIALAAVAGIAGHAFSPFLKFRGGKGITTTFGAWTVMTKWEGPSLFGIILGAIYILMKKRKGELTPGEDALIVVFAFAGLLIYTLYSVLRGNYALMIFYIGNLFIVIYKHKRELSGILTEKLRRKKS